MRDGVDIPGAENSSYVIASLDSSHAGSYICKINNTIATELTLYSRSITVAVSGDVGVTHTQHQSPDVFVLFQNCPNPFNPITDIRYQIAAPSPPSRCADRSGGNQNGIEDVRFPVHTSLKIYNILGQEVRTLVDDVQEPGYYAVTWDGRDEGDQLLSSGVYFYWLQSGEFTALKKMLLLR
ncbi:MAG: hypothetical protein JSV84_02330, partial [Gemmatimonadota bacterium]